MITANPETKNHPIVATSGSKIYEVGDSGVEWSEKFEAWRFEGEEREGLLDDDEDWDVDPIIYGAVGRDAADGS